MAWSIPASEGGRALADTTYQVSVLAQARRRKFNQRKKTIAVFSLSCFLLVTVIFAGLFLGETAVTTDLSAKYISLNFDEDSWTEQDGFWYYNGVVEPGKETEPLFTKVSFSKDMPNAYMNARIEIDVHADAVQSKNNGGSALNASGWSDAD